MKRSTAAHTTRHPTVSQAVTWWDTTIPAMQMSASANSLPRFGSGVSERLVTVLRAQRIELWVRRIDEHANAASGR